MRMMVATTWITVLHALTATAACGITPENSSRLLAVLLQFVEDRRPGVALEAVRCLCAVGWQAIVSNRSALASITGRIQVRASLSGPHVALLVAYECVHRCWGWGSGVGIHCCACTARVAARNCLRLYLCMVGVVLISLRLCMSLRMGWERQCFSHMFATSLFPFFFNFTGNPARN
jgi:hypothetical protein